MRSRSRSRASPVFSARWCESSSLASAGSLVTFTTASVSRRVHDDNFRWSGQRGGDPRRIMSGSSMTRFGSSTDKHSPNFRTSRADSLTGGRIERGSSAARRRISCSIASSGRPGGNLATKMSAVALMPNRRPSSTARAASAPPPANVRQAISPSVEHRTYDPPGQDVQRRRRRYRWLDEARAPQLDRPGRAEQALVRGRQEEPSPRRAGPSARPAHPLEER